MEEILVVPSDMLAEILPEGDFIRENIDEILEKMLGKHFFAPRDKAEYDLSMKQLIPYVLVKKEEKYFLLRRLKKQTEARLHEKLSLGVGGHMNPNEGENPIFSGMLRELHEELFVEKIDKISCVGLLNDKGSEVSLYHLGVVFLLETSGAVSVRETEKMAGSFERIEDIKKDYEKLETWSQILVDSFLTKHA